MPGILNFRSRLPRLGSPCLNEGLLVLDISRSAMALSDEHPADDLKAEIAALPNAKWLPQRARRQAARLLKSL